MTDCPHCQLPQEDNAWQCDGCGYEFRQDYDAVRLELRTKLRRSRVGLWLTVGTSLGIVGGLVYLVTHGWIYISVSLLVGLVASIGHSIHKVSVLRGHLASLDRRHIPLPKATARLGPGTDSPR